MRAPVIHAAGDLEVDTARPGYVLHSVIVASALIRDFAFGGSPN